jgi:hypothetical protein
LLSPNKVPGTTEYDRHWHPIRVLPGTLLHDWFTESLDGEEGGAKRAAR